MIAVLDASAAAEIIFERGKADAFLTLLDGCEEVLVPELYLAEIANVLWKHRCAGEIDDHGVRVGFDRASVLSDRIVSHLDLMADAVNEALVHRHSVYDVLYAVLARRSGATLVTCDKALKTLARKMGVETA